MGLVKEMLRVYLLALERKIGAEIPTHHPTMAWLVKHTAENITKYMVGWDGKTAYQRHFVKAIKDEGLEFGELVYDRKRKGDMRDLEAHWMPGVWLGKPWGSITHQVWTGSKVIDAHAVQRRPRDERWSKEELLKITAPPGNVSREPQMRGPPPRSLAEEWPRQAKR